METHTLIHISFADFWKKWFKFTPHTSLSTLNLVRRRPEEAKQQKITHTLPHKYTQTLSHQSSLILKHNQTFSAVEAVTHSLILPSPHPFINPSFISPSFISLLISVQQREKRERKRGRAGRGEERRQDKCICVAPLAKHKGYTVFTYCTVVLK